MRNDYRCDRFEELNASEQRIIRNKIRRNRIVRRQRLMLVAAIMAVVILSVCMFLKMSIVLKAQSEDMVPTCKYYKVVTLHAGDNLWDIASNYYATDEYKDFTAYLTEICSINHLDCPDEIKAGENVIIPYFDVYR